MRVVVTGGAGFMVQLQDGLRRTLDWFAAGTPR